LAEIFDSKAAALQDKGLTVGPLSERRNGG